jgi:hypothetical protein
MAKMLDLPILVILQNGLYQDGLLEDKHGWYVYRTKLRPDELDSNQFVGTLDDWVKRVNTKPAVALEDPAQLTIGDLFRRMKPGQLWGTLAALLALLAGAVTVGAWVRNAHGEGVSGRNEHKPSPVEALTYAYDAAVAPSLRAQAMLDYVQAKRASGPLNPPGLDLREMNLRGHVTLASADLSVLNLQGADFSGATMDDVRLSSTLLVNASLVRTSLIRADLRGTNLNGADLRGAAIGGVKVDANTTLLNANLCGVAVPEFMRTNLHDGICPDGSAQVDCNGHWEPPTSAKIARFTTGTSGMSSFETWTISNLEEVCPSTRR